MFRFTIRDLLTLTLAAGLAIGWWSDHRLHFEAIADAEFLARVAASNCRGLDVGRYVDLQEKYGIKPRTPNGLP